MFANPVLVVSLFTDWLEDYLGVGDVQDIEPEEIRILCEDPVFRKIADYCRKSRGRDSDSVGRDDSAFDLDELGVDPRSEYDAATDL